MGVGAAAGTGTAIAGKDTIGAAIGAVGRGIIGAGTVVTGRGTIGGGFGFIETFVLSSGTVVGKVELGVIYGMDANCF